MCNKKTPLTTHHHKHILVKPTNTLVIFIDLYQKYLSPLFGQKCKHYPSCSHYTQDALRAHGLIKGLILSSARIVRCNPWSLGGYDPIPQKVSYLKPQTFMLMGNYQTQLYKQQ